MTVNVQWDLLSKNCSFRMVKTARQLLDTPAVASDNRQKLMTHIYREREKALC